MKGPYKLELQYTTQERLGTYKHSCLLGPFISYKENKVLWIPRQTSQQLQKLLSGVSVIKTFSFVTEVEREN